jgi:hypothetical protein
MELRVIEDTDMQGTIITPRRLLKATATRLLIVLGSVIVLAEGLHLYALSSTRVQARAALAQTLHSTTASDSRTVTATLDAFDRMTGDIFFATTGPYLVLAIFIPSLLISLARLQSNLSATDAALSSILQNGAARSGIITTPLATTKVNYSANNGL